MVSSSLSNARTVHSFISRTNFPLNNDLSDLTLGFLEAVAPLVVGQLSILEGVAGVEEGLHAHLVLVQIQGAELRLVQEQVKVHVQLIEHPTQ